MLLVRHTNRRLKLQFATYEVYFITLYEGSRSWQPILQHLPCFHRSPRTKAIVCAEETSHSTTIFRFIYSYNFKVLAMFHILMTLDYARCLLVFFTIQQ